MKIFLIMLLLCPFPFAADLRILIKMIPAQEQYFRESVLNEFSKTSGAKITVENFTDNWEIEKKLQDQASPVDVVKVPINMAQSLVKKQLVVPLASIIPEPEFKALKDQYFLMNLATFENQVYFIPRKFETRIMVYLKSRVKDAVAEYPAQKDRISRTLQNAGWPALPEGYTLESDPAQWDWLDVMVAGCIWAAKEYGGKKQGRLGHRGKDYSGTAQDLIDRCYSLGAQPDDILKVNSPAYLWVLKWESLGAGLQLYPAAMWEQGWSGTDLWEAFRRGDIFLSFLTQLDCYFLHGTGSDGMNGYVSDPGDLGFAPMPQALAWPGSAPVKRATSTGGWFWGIGARSANKKLALDLIKFITNSQNQIAETEHFGMIPVRKDILGKANLVFSEPWKTEVFKTSLAQLKLNGNTVLPYAENFPDVEKSFIAAWKKVMVASKSGVLNEEKIKALMEK